jgi:hypothetical protein
MPHFAHCPENIVRKIERIESAVMLDPDGQEDEALGQAYLAGLYPGTLPDEYHLTHYPVGQPDPYPRGKYAGIGDLWTGSEFVSPEQPVASP